MYLVELEIWYAAQNETCDSQDAFLFGIDERLANGIFDSTIICRFDKNQIETDGRFLRNRWKSQSNFIIKVFNKFTNKWIPSYI